jgi:hypothetical protein
MATPVTSRPTTKNYLGNTNKKEVHDLRLEKTSCQIDEIIRARHAVTFSPDTLNQARAEGYDNCHHCLGSSTR